MSQTRLSIEFEREPKGISKERLSAMLKKAIADYLSKHRSKLTSIDLKLLVRKCQASPQLNARLALHMSGTINGKPVNRKTKAKRNSERNGGVSVEHVLTKMAMNFLSRALSGQNPGKRRDAEPFIQCVQECVSDLTIVLDSALGIAESKASKTWKIISSARWYVAIGLPLWVASGNAENFKMLIGRCLSAMFVIGFPVFFAIHVGGLLIMPKSFYKNDPRGRKQLARSGINSVLGLRVACAFIGLFFGFIVLAAMLIMSLPPKEDRPKGKRLRAPAGMVCSDEHTADRLTSLSHVARPSRRFA